MRQIRKLRERNYGEGRIVRKMGSTRLYAVFAHFGRRIEYATRLEDTRDNRLTVQDMLDGWAKKLREKTFRFAEECPLASPKLKALFTELEKKHWGRVVKAAAVKPEEVNFGQFANNWVETVLPVRGPDVERTYKSSLQTSIIPYFKDYSFFEITADEVNTFFNTVTVQRGPRKGKGLTQKTKTSYRTHFEAVWLSARDKYRWTLPSPFPHKTRRPKPKEERMSMKDVFATGTPITPPERR